MTQRYELQLDASEAQELVNILQAEASKITTEATRLAGEVETTDDAILVISVLRRANDLNAIALQLAHPAPQTVAAPLKDEITRKLVELAKDSEAKATRPPKSLAGADVPTLLAELTRRTEGMNLPKTPSPQIRENSEGHWTLAADAIDKMLAETDEPNAEDANPPSIQTEFANAEEQETTNVFDILKRNSE